MSKRTLKVVGYGYILDRRIENSNVISSFDKHQDLGEVFFFLFSIYKKETLLYELKHLAPDNRSVPTL